jgi:hypothetical protein
LIGPENLLVYAGGISVRHQADFISHPPQRGNDTLPTDQGQTRGWSGCGGEGVSTKSKASNVSLELASREVKNGRPRQTKPSTLRAAARTEFEFSNFSPSRTNTRSQQKEDRSAKSSMP